jgi:ABC-type antimicrobial peptide transport system permease subunit
MRDVLLSSTRMLIPGITIGLLLAAGAAQLVRFMLIGVNVLNPSTYLVVAVIQVLIVVIACIGPAVRASRVDPLTALRAE